MLMAETPAAAALTPLVWKVKVIVNRMMIAMEILYVETTIVKSLDLSSMPKTTVV